jgi:hypothetical protein
MAEAGQVSATGKSPREHGFGFHFGTQPNVTYQHPAAPTDAPNSSNRLF